MTVSCYEAAAEYAYNPENGHYYELVNTAINWYDANDAASSMTYSGIVGHLVTITHALENIFLTDTFGVGGLHYHWTGGLTETSSTDPYQGWSWVTEESFSFANWYTDEPNGDGVGRIIFDHGSTDYYGKSWNDLTATELADGYIVEYDTAPVPIPSTILLMGTSLAGLLGLRRRKKA